MPGHREAAVSEAPVLLLTRARPQAERFAAEARARLGPLRCVIAPLIEIAILPLTRDPAAHATLIFTSENGVSAFCSQSDLRDRPAFCVGPRTAAAAREAGFDATSAEAEGGDAEGLLRRLRAVRPAQPLLHLRGEHAVTDLAGRLRREGLACAEAVVYAQRAMPLSPEGLAVLSGRAPVLLPLFSPRSAGLAAQAVAAAGNGGRAAVHVIAISAAAAERWIAVHPDRVAVRVARTPDGAGMLEALAEAVRECPA